MIMFLNKFLDKFSNNSNRTIKALVTTNFGYVVSLVNAAG